MDVDQLNTNLVTGTKLDDVSHNQMHCADVVLLNKCDLVTPLEIDRVKEHVLKELPGVSIHTCQFGEVPLSYVLEVQQVVKPVNDFEPVSHERFQQKLFVSSMDTRALRDETRAAKEMLCNTKKKPHGNVQTMVFESNRPFNLGAWQDFLSLPAVSNVQRIKGWVFFQEDTASEQWTFHFSGRQRFECKRDGSTNSARIVRLAFLGNGLDVAWFEEQLNNCLAKAMEDVVDTGDAAAALSDRDEQSAPPAATDAAVGTTAHTASRLLAAGTAGTAAAQLAAMEMLHADDRLEVSEEQSLGNVVVFRLTMTKALGVSLTDISHRFGVNLNGVNEKLACRINYSTGTAFVTSVLIPGASKDATEDVALRFATDGKQTLKDVWNVVDEAIEGTVKASFAHVKQCHCGW